MKVELKYLDSPDIDLSGDIPFESQKFSFLIRAMIGPVGENASESFDFEVVSLRWLANSGGKMPMFGRHFIIGEKYDIPLIEEKIKELCAKLGGSSWLEIASKLARYGKWEFEDCQTFNNSL